MQPKTDMAKALGTFEDASAEEKAELEGRQGDGPGPRLGAAETLQQHREAIRDTGPGSAQDELDGEDNPTEADEEPMLPAPRPPSDGYPPWAVFHGFDFQPPRGARVAFVRFPSSWTLNTDKGEAHADDRHRDAKNNLSRRLFRWCAMWTLSPGDEIIAAERCRGNPLRTVDEFTMMSIRVVDGYKADWSGRASEGSVKLFWKEVGPACRKELKNVYLQMHALTREQRVDFFANCVVLATSSG